MSLLVHRSSDNDLVIGVYMDVLKTGGVNEVSLMAKLKHASCNSRCYLPRLAFRCPVGD